MEFVECEFAIGKKCLKNLLVFLQGCIAADEFEHLFEDILNFVFDLVEHPLVHFSRRKDARVFQINQMTRGLRLREVEYAFQVADTHFAVDHYQHQDAQTGGVGAGQKNLGSQVNVKVF